MALLLGRGEMQLIRVVIQLGSLLRLQTDMPQTLDMFAHVIKVYQCENILLYGDGIIKPKSWW